MIGIILLNKMFSPQKQKLWSPGKYSIQVDIN